MRKLIIAIDPDIYKNGVAVRNVATKKIDLYSMDFYDCLDFISDNRDEILELRIECGYLNTKTNWHNEKSVGISSKIGNAVGANFQVSRHLVLFHKKKLSDTGIRLKEVKPLKKQWKGVGGKLSHAELESVFKYNERKRTNQEERDAFLMVL